MLEDKIKATDWEATDEQLAELAARESYLQWMKDNQKASNLSQVNDWPIYEYKSYHHSKVINISSL